MKPILLGLVIFLVGSLGVIPAYDYLVYAEDTPKITKQNILTELQSVDLDKKKDQKNLNKAITQLEKTLEDKFWKDDSHLSLLGKKMFNHEKKVIKTLDKIKSHDFSIQITSLVKSDKMLAQNQIDLLPTDTGVKKLEKKLQKANKEMINGQKDVDKNKSDKALDHFKKAWKLAKMGEDIDVPDAGSADFSNDGIPDYYVQLQYTGKDKKPVILDYKIQNECVDLGPKDSKDIGGDTYDDAAMKIGITPINNESLADDIIVWNDWFKKNDENKKVDIFLNPAAPLPDFDQIDADNVVTESSNGVSFEQISTIPQIGDQSGWAGSLFFNAPSGDYIFWTIHPAGGIDGCDRLSALGIHVEIP